MAPVIDPGVDTDLLIVAHGERGGAGDNRALTRLAAQIADQGGFGSVGAAVLRGSPSIEQALGPVRGRRVEVYPLFMSDGYYVREALPARLRPSGRICRFHRPFGLEPGLAALIARQAAAALQARDWAPSQSTLLLVGHGSSKNGDSRDATEWQAARLRALGHFAEVRTAYLENAPFLPEVLAALPLAPCSVVGFFSGEGQHAGVDVPRAVGAPGREGIIYAGPVTAAQGTAGLIARSLRHVPATPVLTP